MAKDCAKALKEKYGDLLTDEMYKQMASEFVELNKKLGADTHKLNIAEQTLMGNWRRKMMTGVQEELLQRTVQNRLINEVRNNISNELEKRVAREVEKVRKRAEKKGEEFDEASARRTALEAITPEQAVEFALAPLEKANHLGEGVRDSVSTRQALNLMRFMEHLEYQTWAKELQPYKDGAYTLDVLKTKRALRILMQTDETLTNSIKNEPFAFKEDGSFKTLQEIRAEADAQLKAVPPELVDLAKLYNQMDMMAIDMLREAGLKPNVDMNYVAKHSHDAVRISAAGETVWIEAIRKQLDHRRPFRDVDFPLSEEQITQRLQDIYRKIKNRDFSGFDGSRTLNFRDIESWMAYDKEFGSGVGHYEMHLAGAKNVSRRAGLVSRLGPRPQETVNALKRTVQDLVPQADNITLRKIDESYDFVTGAVFRPLRTVGKTVQRVKILGKPLEMTFSAINAISNDIPSLYASYRHRGGLGVLEAGFQVFSDVFTTTLENLPFTVQRKEFLRGLKQIGVDVENSMNSFHGRHEGNIFDQAEGAFAWIDYHTNTVNGLRVQTQNFKGARAKAVVRDFNTAIEAGWDNMFSGFRTMLELHGMGKTDIENLKLVYKDGYEFSNLKRLSDEFIDDLVVPDDLIPAQVREGKLNEAQTARIMKKTRERYSYELRRKVMGMFNDDTNIAVTTMGVKEARQLPGSNMDPNSLGGALMSFVRKYKGTAWKAWNDNALMARSGKHAGKKWGMAYYMGTRLFMAAMLRVGIDTMGSMINASVRGEDPVMPWEEEHVVDYAFRALQRGGGLGLISDYTFGIMNHPTQGLAGIAGPEIGRVSRVLGMLPDLMKGKDMSGQAMKFLLYNTPGIGLPGLHYLREGWIDMADEWIKEAQRIERRNKQRNR